MAPWNPTQYLQFRDERARPFHDLLGLVQCRGPRRVVDLGCGTGALTVTVHETLGASETVGIDASAEMLERAPGALPSGLSFRRATIEEWIASRPEPVDVVFSNAALHWVEDHVTLIPSLARLVAPGGEIAFQVPAMHEHTLHTVARNVAEREPFRSALGTEPRRSPVLAPPHYAALLHAAGFVEQRVRLEIYAHALSHAQLAVEWVRGSLLTWYEDRLGDHFEAFVEQYTAELLDTLGLAGDSPWLLPYERIFAWGRRA